MAMEIVENGPMLGKPSRPSACFPPGVEPKGRWSDRGHGPRRATIVAIHLALGQFASADDGFNAIAASARRPTSGRRWSKRWSAGCRSGWRRSRRAIRCSHPERRRVRALKNYAALRKQIAQLTVPPEEDAAAPKNRIRAETLSTFMFVLQPDGRVRTLPPR